MTALHHQHGAVGRLSMDPGQHWRRRGVRDDHRPPKELIINAAGTNMPPPSIENAVPAASLLGAHAVVIGPRRPHVTAPTVPDPPPPRSPPSMASPTSPRRLGQSTPNCRVQLTRLKNGLMSATTRPDGAALSR